MANGTCSIPECGRTGRVVLGWCIGHYTRWSRTGDVGSPQLAPARVKIAPGTPCSAKACDRPAHCRGWCKAHYSRWERHGDIFEDVPIDLPVGDRPPRSCSLPNCGREHVALGYCAPHYQRVREHGDPRADVPIAASATSPRGCDVDGCGDGHYSLGFCVRHHYRFTRYGDPLGGQYLYDDLIRRTRPLPPVERFWSRVDKNGPVPTHRPELGPCWIWLAALNGNGYGQTFSFPEIGQLAHRIAWRLSGRELIDGLELDHLCRTEACVRPSHLDQVPKLVNILRGNGCSARNARKTHCSRSHEYTPENTKVDARGHRHCLTCTNGTFRYHALRRNMTREDRRVSADYRVAIANDPCRYCGAPGEEVDHFIALHKGGTDHFWNLGRACVRCNRSKGTRCGTWFILRDTRRPAAMSLVS